MISFREISLSDLEICKTYFEKSKNNSCDYTFGNLYNWKDEFDYKIAFSDEFMFVRFGSDNPKYFLPIGEGDISVALSQLKQDSKNELFIYGVTSEDINRLQKSGVAIKKTELFRDASDYIYNSEDLKNLIGKKYHSKRNFISRFKSNYNWNYENVDRLNIQECIDFCLRWFSKQTEIDIKQEEKAVLSALNNFFELGFKGGVLRVDGKIIAFTAGEPINDKTFCVHIEKADTEYIGAYTMLNNQFAINTFDKYTYINREEDMGIEGLRKAKESYYPAFILEKFNIII